MVDTRDILLKAAEDVTQGMWCKGGWFLAQDHEYDIGWVLWPKEAGLYDDTATLTVEEAQSMKRCAGGSILLASKLLGGTSDDAFDAMQVVYDRLGQPLQDFNDGVLPDDPFEAGQQLAELFRQTAESL